MMTLMLSMFFFDNYHKNDNHHHAVNARVRQMCGVWTNTNAQLFISPLLRFWSLIVIIIQ